MHLVPLELQLRDAWLRDLSFDMCQDRELVLLQVIYLTESSAMPIDQLAVGEAFQEAVASPFGAVRNKFLRPLPAPDAVRVISHLPIFLGLSHRGLGWVYSF